MTAVEEAKGSTALERVEEVIAADPAGEVGALEKQAGGRVTVQVYGDSGAGGRSGGGEAGWSSAGCGVRLAHEEGEGVGVG
jgi:hypothetical protein